MIEAAVFSHVMVDRYKRVRFEVLTAVVLKK
jgi:hypothetical protein